jgi:translocation and assembly module TamB
MRMLRLVGWGLGGVLAVLVLLLVAMQTGPVQQWMASTVSRLVSTADHSIEVTGLSGTFPTDLAIERIAVGDREGTWLEAEAIRIEWSLRPLLAGRLHIDSLSARRLAVLRPPAADAAVPEGARAEGGGGLPLDVELGSLSVADLHLGSDLLGPESRWRLQAGGVLPADLAAGNLNLRLDRTDGPTAHLTLDARFDLRRLWVDGQLEIGEESTGGVIATLLGRPDVEGVSLRLTAKGDATGGNMELQAGAGDVLTSAGWVRWRGETADTAISFKLDVAASNLPDGPLARALRDPIAAAGEATFDQARILTVHRATVDAGPLQVGLSGRYEVAADSFDGSVDLRAGEPGPFADLLDGVSWRNLQASATLVLRDLGTRPLGTVSLTATAEDVAGSDPERRLPSGRSTATAALELRPDGRFVVRESTLIAAGATVRASGHYLPATGSGEGRAAIEIDALAAFSALAGMDLAGRGRLEIQASLDRERLRLAWQGAFQDLGVLPEVPPALLRPTVRTSGVATLRDDDVWRLVEARLASDVVTLRVDGSGRGGGGELEVSVALADLRALDARLEGRLAASSRLVVEDDRLRGEVRAEGIVAGQPLAFEGGFRSEEGGGVSVSSVRGSWASATIDVRSLSITPQGTTGEGRLRVSRLEDIGVLVGRELAGSVDLTVATDGDGPGTVRATLQADDVRGEGFGARSIRLEGTVADPFGIADADLGLDASGLSGIDDLSRLSATVKGTRAGFDVVLRGEGGRSNADLAARVAHSAERIEIALSRLAVGYRGLPIRLAAAATVRIADERLTAEPLTLQVGSGRIRLVGIVDPVASDFEVDVTSLPLNLLAALAPGIDLEGTLRARLRLRGPSTEPRIEASYDASGLRLRRPGMSLMPALALRGTANVVDRRAAFDIRLSGGGATRLTLKGGATLAPFAAKVDVAGLVDLAPFASLLGNDIRNVAGTLRPNLSLELVGGKVTGRGTARLAGAAFALPDTGLRLIGGQGTLALEGDTLRLQRLVFETAGGGQVSADGRARLDPGQGFPLDLTATSRRALVVSRPDMTVTVSSDIRAAGSTASGIDVSGRIHVDRAEIVVGTSEAAGYPVVEVREINVPAGEAPPPGQVNASAPAAEDAKPALPVRLALTVDAPAAVFVRGRGLDAEIGGSLQIGGDTARSTVLGDLTLRRGTLDLAGRRLAFSRGNVSLTTGATVDAALDFTASTTVQSTTINVTVGGTARAPTFAVSSSPALPPDEALAVLLFGKPSSGLSAFELLRAAEVMAEMGGAGPSPTGLVGRVRRLLGLDQLSVDTSSATDNSGNAASSVSVGAGRYIAPGVYVGARQGANPGSSRGVVEIEVLDHVKVEGDIGAETDSRIGIKMEWDY